MSTVVYSRGLCLCVEAFLWPTLYLISLLGGGTSSPTRYKLPCIGVILYYTYIHVDGSMPQFLIVESGPSFNERIKSYFGGLLWAKLGWVKGPRKAIDYWNLFTRLITKRPEDRSPLSRRRDLLDALTVCANITFIIHNKLSNRP